MSLGVLGVDMRQLDTCDFCGEQPEGVYEVVPDSLAGGPQRLALCASCRDTLQSVVDPLLDAAERGGGAESSPSASESADQPDISMPNGTDSSDVAGAAGAAAEERSPEESATEDSTNPESGADEPTEESPAKKPDGYAQVLRLLQNRNEAMPRADLRALATNAYDLDGRTFEKAVDAAVENGDVDETADGLRTL